MAIESPSVLDTLIAWSSSHLSLCHESYQVRALEDRSSALASFASSISTNGLSPELSLAGCLILCSMEAILGDTSDWYEHLVGAAQIIRSTNVDSTGRRGMATLSRTLEGRWLLRNFAYHDILMSVTLNCEPLIAGPYWISDNENVNVVDSYFGLATQPMRLLSTISFLNADMLGCSLYLYSDDSSFPPTLNGYQDDGFFNGDRNLPFKVFSSRAFRIESQLQEWVCVESPDRSLMSLAETYRSAALIHLCRTIRRHFPAMTVILNKKIALQVDAIVQHVGDMPPECLPECTLLFPLFMAGGEADCESHIRYIRQRMLDLAAFRRFHNVDAALSVLEELWRLKASTMPIDGQRVVDWSEITERRGWKLALS